MRSPWRGRQTTPVTDLIGMDKQREARQAATTFQSLPGPPITATWAKGKLTVAVE